MKSFLDYSDVNGVVHPKDIKYLRYVRFWLRIVACWPTRVVGEKVTTFTILFKYFNVFVPALCVTLTVAFVINHIKIWTFFEMGQVYINVMLCTLYTARQLIPLTKRYETLLGEFINEVHLFHHKHRSDYAMKMHLFCHKLSHLFTVYVIGVVTWGYILYNMIPVYNNYVGGGYGSHMPANFSYDYAIYYEVPFDYMQDLKVHTVMFLFNLYSGMTCTTSFCINDLMLSLQMFHVWGHLKILIYNMENFPKPMHYKAGGSQQYQNDVYTAEELKDVTQRLNDIVKHHNLVLRHLNDISETFGLAIAAYYMLHLLMSCVLLLEISDLDPKALFRYGPLTLIALQLQIQISSVFELVSSMTDQLIRAAYSLPWEFMNKGNSQVAHLILLQCQRPLGLKAIGMVEVGLQTTVTVLKTTLSYFIMLKTVATE